MPSVWLWPDWTDFLHFVTSKKAVCIFLIRQKHCWSYFAFNQLCLAKGKIDWIALVLHETNRLTKIHIFTLADQDWIGLMGLKNLRIRTGWDSISSDQDWTWTEKFHSLLISGGYHDHCCMFCGKLFFISSNVLFFVHGHMSWCFLMGLTEHQSPIA